MKKPLMISIGIAIMAIISIIIIVGDNDSKQDISLQEEKPAKLRVVASFYPLYEFSKNVAGDKAEVSTFIPNGIEPHDWEPTTNDILNLKESDIFVYNGAGMEPFVDKLIDSGEYNNVKFVETTKGINLIQTNDEHQKEPDDHIVYNPHVWLDPILAKHQVMMIKDAMVDADPDKKGGYEDNANAYGDKLDELNSKIQTELSNCKKDTFMPFHDAYSYFANQYRLKTFPLSGISPESEVTATDLREFVDFIQKNEIKTIYSEEMVDPKLATTLAEEANAQVLIFSPLEGLTDKEMMDGSTYLDKMSENVQNLKIGLEC
ncbi:MAG: zinc ABC transporter substrate-binding protein [Thaumarchaeota archaeon]|nr:zinc ABC transporter substrate-binding protein [Nitrososphaerota archaeon]